MRAARSSPLGIRSWGSFAGRRVLGIFARHHVDIETVPCGIDIVSVVCSDAALKGKMDAIYHDIMTECTPDTVEIASCIALIATVGTGMVRVKGVAAHLFEALSAAGMRLPVLISADRRSSFGAGVELLAALKSAGIEAASVQVSGRDE